MKSMATRFIFLCFSLFSSTTISFAKATSRFPSSILRPEKLSLSTENELYKAKYFTQTLDHFNYHPKSYETFQQRYLINDTSWGGAEKNAPIFVYTGNEGNIEWFAQNTGFVYEIAPRFEALIVFIEHRFYGESMPFGGDKKVAYKNTSTLGYLSSTQALADYATLIIDLKKNLSAPDSPVVVFGGSYGGSQVRSESENCYKVIKGSWQQIEDTANQPGGLDLLRKSFRICNNSSVAGSLAGWLETALIYTPMTDYPTPSNFLNPLPAYPVKQMCKAIDDPTGGNDTFAKLYGAANVYYNYSGDATCFDLDDNSDPHGLSGWTWQACTEMIMPTDGSNKESIFPASEWDYNDLASFCEAYFNVEPRPTWITTEFGGHDINRVLKRFGSNIIFFNGLRDPWSGGGVLKNISESIIAITAKEGAHHVDLRFSTSEDPGWLKDVRRREVNIITEWLSQYYHSLTP
ncbi:hypothetical protein RHSIM_Rhsim03G0069400 [Rhododendron simsii]|uniref:Lysosomal Pro-X carboxypeptidase n=1 Tax=Rhododendron simsii TaxID=118357 RepID=A0A834H6F7_RHOSS|nr:hypothetical protein RHSIM_Rhsim03G0069400 [Rhododendron simsii]